jgi:uncharacterized membrane protein YbhN (UPF0104 family)
MTITVIAAVVIVRTVDGTALRRAFDELLTSPLRTLPALAAFAAAFLVRAIVWHQVLPGLSLGHSWAAIHVALAANHVLPLRLGEPLRVVSAVRRGGAGRSEAIASTLTLRAADLLSVVAIAWILGAGNLEFMSSPLVEAAVIALGAAAILGLAWMWRMRTHDTMSWPGVTQFAGTAAAWIAESGLVLMVAGSAGIDLAPVEALFVTSVSVVSQVAAIAPGGFGTYEAGAVAAYVFLGYDPGTALAAALAAHALKTAYSVVAGGIGLFVPNPALVGRLRLDRRLEPAVRTIPTPDTGPIVLFMPAHNEGESVAEVIARVPDQVRGHPVVTLVINDGSTDDTAVRAAAAGATVHSFATNRGLGAAVRSGFIHSLAKSPVAVAFCDADGEYPPEELENLIGPILDDRADYVIGSRFDGQIERMLPHRRFGNKVLTYALSFVARRRISDGQTGYRAFSVQAASDVEIIHDFNYAQVITLDLLAKGYRYLEVPISYRFRTTGESFIKLGRYLRRVIPAVYRQLNKTPAVADDPTQ